jgi:hypothetical protein
MLCCLLSVRKAFGPLPVARVHGQPATARPPLPCSCHLQYSTAQGLSRKPQHFTPAPCPSLNNLQPSRYACQSYNHDGASMMERPLLLLVLQGAVGAAGGAPGGVPL